MGAQDWDRVGGGEGGPMLDARKKYIDPRDKAKSEFRQAFHGCSQHAADLQPALDRIDKFKNLVNLNMHLLAQAACFHSLYAKKGGVNRKNVTEFIDDNHSRGADPIDIIRYVRFYSDE